ncbi:phosphotransferase enzyme family protein [Chitinasiproducens palmae]|uniref:Ser/Thr protein kinase RdoA involved in Cpx stress response, MazF antagonist n=1 Tax=Chitinasiproducens palmae TaxID=1770053 RepID=A0A1H2PKY8_9BURK|nr:aminoglycoside phosphotransferase family protein [Chitinasiproducens palmae]SDV47061.1 Ser/Thr protein kinase RdoA involved in Cpx stress response, MazF antagonist [Chitinasiproducens palmae]
MLPNDVETLVPLLDRHWGLRPAGMQVLSSGHTNRSFLVRCASDTVVLRVSWPGKPIEQAHREAAILSALGAGPFPHALAKRRPTLSGQPETQTGDGRRLHVFEHIAGQPGLPEDRDAGVLDAMRTLARLHAAMESIPANAASPVDWLQRRFSRVAARPAPMLAATLSAAYDTVIDRIRAALADATGWIWGPVHWVHGDYHAGNLLYRDGRVNGVIDFDDVGQGSHWLEAAFAAFALSRDASRDDAFVFDKRRWDAGAQAYATLRHGTAPPWLRNRRGALLTLFCAEQTLIHLEAAQHELWTPGPGIGFLAGWRHLLAIAPGRDSCTNNARLPHD